MSEYSNTNYKYVPTITHMHIYLWWEINHMQGK